MGVQLLMYTEETSMLLNLITTNICKLHKHNISRFHWTWEAISR